MVIFLSFFVQLEVWTFSGSIAKKNTLTRKKSKFHLTNDHIVKLECVWFSFSFSYYFWCAAAAHCFDTTVCSFQVFLFRVRALFKSRKKKQNTTVVREPMQHDWTCGCVFCVCLKNNFWHWWTEPPHITAHTQWETKPPSATFSPKRERETEILFIDISALFVLFQHFNPLALSTLLSACTFFFLTVFLVCFPLRGLRSSMHFTYTRRIWK